MEENQVFDDFKTPEASIYVNDTIGRVFEKELSDIEQFKEDLDDQLMMADSPKDQLTEMIIGYIQGVGDVNQVNICSYRAKNGVAIDAWGFNGDEDMTTIDLFLTLYIDPADSNKISLGELDRHFNWLQRFYDQSLSGSIFPKIEENRSDLFQVASLINKTPNIDRIRLFILTNAIMPSNYDKSNIELDTGTNCEFYVWDAKRVMQQDHIISGRNPIVVDFEGDYNCTLPCIKMPDVSDSVSCYLCIIPGMVLSQVYHKYHQQILEMNVRTFLQFKGASNKGIRDTLIGHKATPAEKRKGICDADPEPDMFFAYNNGISATASEVKLNEEGTAITRIKSWQIVNGGQTTAAISAVLGMKDIDISQLAQVYVAMKISVIKNKENLPDIVPKISRYANTQSAVKKSDFNINEEFLVELEQRSREEWVLNSSGNPVSKWFFERTRGQYLDKAKRQSNGSKTEREFYAEYPKNQMFDKTTLSKFMIAWDQNPASVYKGGENNYGIFFERMKQAGIRFDKIRYHRTIAKVILFKAIDAYYGKDGIALPGYKSNMVAYTVSLLSYVSNKALDLDTIWREQCVITPAVYNEMTIDLYSIYAKLISGAEHITYKVKESYTTTDGRRRNRYVPKSIPIEDLNRLKETMIYKVLLYVKKVQPFIYSHIIEVNEGENINEWSKKTLCWDALKTKLSSQGTYYNIPAELCSTSGDLDTEVTEGQQKFINEAATIDTDVWFSINKWSKENPGELTPKEQAFVGQVGFNLKRNRSLTYKQSKWALDILDKAKEKGWEK
ncbi:AIPR family protein [Bacteroides thetaiotaomicron]|uniref:AIPR family protein n=1 Tax=Bacteroides thetaiotaomicron TaxID=818 RepID=UPI001899F77D|nr:AIPR family protein [Bacteroides thetaiotaomicron]MDC2272791.1 AIPR family protein [Bacteroides thetaiotaomicron]